MLPAHPRLPRGERQAGGGLPAAGQDALGLRGAHRAQTPGPAHPAPLAPHPDRLPGRLPLWPAGGHGLVRGQRRRLHLRPGGQHGAERPGGGRGRRSQGAPRRGRGREDAGLHHLRLCRQVVEPRTPRRRPPGSQHAWLRSPLRRHLAQGRGAAPLREHLLRPRPGREPDQDAQSATRLRPHLLPEPGRQPGAPRPPYRRLLADVGPSRCHPGRQSARQG